MKILYISNKETDIYITDARHRLLYFLKREKNMTWHKRNWPTYRNSPLQENLILYLYRINTPNQEENTRKLNFLDFKSFRLLCKNHCKWIGAITFSRPPLQHVFSRDYFISLWHTSRQNWFQSATVFRLEISKSFLIVFTSPRPLPNAYCLTATFTFSLQLLLQVMQFVLDCLEGGAKV